MRQTFTTVAAFQQAPSAAKARIPSAPPTIQPSGPGSFGSAVKGPPCSAQFTDEDHVEEEEEEEEEQQQVQIQEGHEKPGPRKGMWGKVRGQVKLTSMLKNAGKENAKSQSVEVSTLGIVLDGLLIEAIVPGSPAYHSNGTIEKGDRMRKVGTVMVTAADVKQELRKYYQHIGADVVIGIKKASSGDNAEVKLRTIDSSHFKYQILITEAIAKVSASIRRKANFTHDLMMKHSATDPNAVETAGMFRALREETDER